MYVIGESNDAIYEYDLSINWDISSAVYLQSLLVTDSDAHALFFAPTGEEFYMTGNGENVIYQYRLSGWIIDSFVGMKGTLNWSNVTKSVGSVVGSNVSWRVRVNDSINQWNISEVFSYTLTAPPVVTCDCPSTGNWDIDDGSICKPTENCNIGTNKLRITDGGLLIDSGINVRTGGCYVADQERLFIEDGGGLFCGS